MKLTATSMKHLIFILFLSIIFFSCNGDKKNSFQQHDKLISWQSKFISEGGENINEDLFNKHLKIKTSADTLIVDALKEVNSCGRSIADIKISGDTLYLLTRLISDTVCASADYHLFTYKVMNPENKKYIVITGK